MHRTRHVSGGELHRQAGVHYYGTLILPQQNFGRDEHCERRQLRQGCRAAAVEVGITREILRTRGKIVRQ